MAIVHTRRDIGLVAIYVGLAILAALSFFPLLHTVAISFSHSAKAASGVVSFLPIGFTLEAYRNILDDTAFFRAFWVSIQRVTLAAGLGFVVVVLTAYPLSKTRRDFGLRDVFAWLVVFVMLFPPPLIPMYLTIRGLNLIGSIWSLVLPGFVNSFLIILVLNFFRNIPNEMDESASIDGANPWQKLIRIMIPLSKPVLATITLFTIVWHWNAFFDGLIYMNRTEDYPLQTYIQQLVITIDPNSFDIENMSRIAKVSDRTLNAAKIVVTTLPVLILYPFLQRFFISGIMLGSVKE